MINTKISRSSIVHTSFPQLLIVLKEILTSVLRFAKFTVAQKNSFYPLVNISRIKMIVEVFKTILDPVLNGLNQNMYRLYGVCLCRSRNITLFWFQQVSLLQKLSAKIKIIMVFEVYTQPLYRICFFSSLCEVETFCFITKAILNLSIKYCPNTSSNDFKKWL